MRPTVRFLTDDLIKQIVDEAVNILCTLGLQIHNKQILSMLADHQAKVDMDSFHVNLTEDIIQKAIKTVPHSFKLYDVIGNQTHDFSDYSVHFTPASAALNILDSQIQQSLIDTLKHNRKKCRSKVYVNKGYSSRSGITNSRETQRTKHRSYA